MEGDRFQGLFKKYIAGTASAEEELELMGLLLDPSLADRKNELMEAAYDQLPATFVMADARAEQIFSQIISNRAVVRPLKTFWARVAVAASLLIALTTAGLLFFNRNISKPVTAKILVSRDVEAPRQTKAIITLADGKKIPLDSLSTASLSLHNGVRVAKTTGGEIVYEGKSSVEEYNTLTNPRGSKPVSLVLSDRTKLWLNCESSVRYPVAFSDNERKVEITGEAYFEVASAYSKSDGKKIPFIVQSGRAAVRVLGTHFNVNAYPDEANIAVTLLEGSVQVSDGDGKSLIVPGQQAILKGSEIRIENADTDAAIAWKEGRFQFGGKVDIKTIMQQVSRWYDVDIEYKGNVTDHFGGSISRAANISELFRIMEATDKIKFELDGKKVIVAVGH